MSNQILPAFGKKKLIGMVQIIRFRPSAGAAGSVYLGLCLSNQSWGPPTWQSLVGFAMVFSWFAFGNTSNDFLDIQTDAVSKPSRPLITGVLTRAEALTMTAFFAGLTLALGALGGNRFFMVGAASLVLAAAYNLYLKRVFFLGNLVIALWGSLPIALIPIAEGNFTNFTITGWLSVFFFLLGNEILSGATTIPGDKAAGRETIAAVFGRRNTVFFGGGAIFLGLVTLNSSLLYLEQGFWFLASFWLLLIPTLLYIGIRIVRSASETEFFRAHIQAWLVGATLSAVILVLAVSA